MKHSKILRLGVEDFACMFGTTVDGLPVECKDLIKQFDFRYKQLNRIETYKILSKILEMVKSNRFSMVGPDRKPVWEKGWKENLKSFRECYYDVDRLIPLYIKPNQPVRYGNGFIMPIDSGFELNWFKVYREWLFRTFLTGVNNVFDFGCGTGHNLVALARMYPEYKLVGLDWTRASMDIIQEIVYSTGYNISGRCFDMFHPDRSLSFPGGSAVLTMGSMEQLGTDWDKMLGFILDANPVIVVHSEPLYELYDGRRHIDETFMYYHSERNYLFGYLTRLRELESKGLIDILKVLRVGLGNMFQEGYSVVVWKPR